MTTKLPSVPSQEKNRNGSPDFSQLGGRIKPDGTYPTPEEWLADHAMPADLVFKGDNEVKTFFQDQVDRIGAFVRESGATRETIISRLFTIANERIDLISDITFNQLPVGRRNGLYAPDSLLKATVPGPTFSATIDVREARHVYPKMIPTSIEIKDHIVKGLDNPHALMLSFDKKGFYVPWSLGGGSGEPAAVTISLGGKDFSGEPVFINGLYKCADPEAIEQTLDFCEEMAIEIFTVPAESAIENPHVTAQ